MLFLQYLSVKYNGCQQMDELDKLKMNTDKTEIMLCGSLQKLKRIDVNSVIIDDECVYFSK